MRVGLGIFIIPNVSASGKVESIQPYHVFLSVLNVAAFLVINLLKRTIPAAQPRTFLCDDVIANVGDGRLACGASCIFSGLDRVSARLVFNSDFHDVLLVRGRSPGVLVGDVVAIVREQGVEDITVVVALINRDTVVTK